MRNPWGLALGRIVARVETGHTQSKGWLKALRFVVSTRGLPVQHMGPEKPTGVRFEIRQEGSRFQEPNQPLSNPLRVIQCHFERWLPKEGHHVVNSARHECGQAAERGRASWRPWAWFPRSEAGQTPAWLGLNIGNPQNYWFPFPLNPTKNRFRDTHLAVVPVKPRFLGDTHPRFGAPGDQAIKRPFRSSFPEGTSCLWEDMAVVVKPLRSHFGDWVHHPF